MSARRVGVISLLFVASVTAVALYDDGDARRGVAVALESDEAAALAAQAGIRLQDFWARAKALGVTAAVVRPQPLEDAVKRGEILRFDKAELERWKAVGLLAPQSALRAGTFWTKDERLYDRLMQAAAAQGVAAATSSAGGYRLVELTQGRDLVLTGYDPERVKAAEGLDLVYASPDGRLETELAPATWAAGASRGALLRLAHSRPRRLLILRVDPALGLEANAGRFRAAVKELIASGVPLSDMTA